MARVRVTKISEHIPSTLEETIEQFLSWKRAQGLSKQTLSDYKQHVNQFYKRYPGAFGSHHLQLEKWLCEYFAEDIKPSTYNNRLVYLRAFFDWCVDKTGLLNQNPLQGFKKRKAEGRIVEHDEETLIALINAPDKKTFAGLRDYALILLALDTGIRPKERSLHFLRTLTLVLVNFTLRRRMQRHGSLERLILARRRLRQLVN